MDWEVPIIVVSIVASVSLMAGGAMWLDTWCDERAQAQCQQLCRAAGVMVLTTHGDCVCREGR